MGKQSLAQREALRIFRLVLVVQLVLIALSGLAALGLGQTARMGMWIRLAPTVLLVLLFLPPWLEEPLGRYHLGVGLALYVFISSLEVGWVFAGQWVSSRLWLELPPEVYAYLTAAPLVEPFLFLLIPLVLMAWGYGRRGALLGSTWAALLHLVITAAVAPSNEGAILLLAQALARIALLYVVPLIVSVLAERERNQLAELEATHQRLRRHTATVEQLATSRERNRLARDLHDTLAHTLSAIMVQLEALRTLLANDPAAAEQALDDLAAQARQGLEDSRQAIQALRTDRVETLGLANALRDRLQAFQARSGVLTSLSVAGDEPDLTAAESRTIFLIIDETLSNVERHASARKVTARLDLGADCIDLVIQDDGVGFDPDTVSLDRFGLTGMRERAGMIGATLEVESRRGGGTTVWCSLQK